jgi:hypothetical protein
MAKPRILKAKSDRRKRTMGDRRHFRGTLSPGDIDRVLNVVSALAARKQA